ncbi:ATP-dependent nuclease [Microbulbifer sp. ANSA003]|uniref:ATP-dependent nuclease n=1 Tax=Microbulbifer sp. ANSA003 TaxID=3243360 RepID=UPI004040FC1A
MKVANIKISNYRLLKDFSLDLEDNLSLIIGKNNTGKTSILTAIDKFINPSEKNPITIDDFNVNLKKKLSSILVDPESIGTEEEYKPLGITLRVIIDYDENDDLSAVRNLIMNLDISHNSIVLGFEYQATWNKLHLMVNTYDEQKEKYNNDPNLFLKENIQNYFGPIKRKSIDPADDANFVDLAKEGISLREVICFKYISAKRSVTNKNNDKTLSTQTSQIYKKSPASDEHQSSTNAFKDKLRSTDLELTDIYRSMFSEVLQKVAKFGGIEQNETDIKIASTLQDRELLEGNTTVFYAHDDHNFPEHYNGLGYMNLISMIFEIEVVMSEFKRTLTESPSAINVLFIEEPEAHTHPQMQYIFIKNIKNLLSDSRERTDGISINLQTLISTHSSHIVSESDFNDIKYLRKSIDKNSVESKNLKDLQKEYRSSEVTQDAAYKRQFKFLKQYLTLNRSEIFFAEKVILIEGDTERVLLPAMMRKIDQEESEGISYTPLLSQNISIIEVGAHSKTFEKFIRFIGAKTLVITDIDSYYEKITMDDNGKEKQETIVCSPNDPNAEKTSNSSLLFFHDKNKEDLEYFKSLTLPQKILSFKNGKWEKDENGSLLTAYQMEEKSYHPRSFEDAFFSINKEFLGDDSYRFPSLTKKWFDKYIDDQDPTDVFTFSNKAIGSKPSLAIEILINSKGTQNSEFSNWKIPSYIKEGLTWLRKN